MTLNKGEKIRSKSERLVKERGSRGDFNNLRRLEVCLLTSLKVGMMEKMITISAVQV